MLSKFREPVNGLTHLGGAILAFFGMIALLIVGWNPPIKLISVIIYGVSLIALFLASGIYHTVRVTPAIQAILRKFDHSAIFVLIAGTYTPFCLNAFTGFWRWGLLAIIWAIAAIGILVKIYFANAPRWLHTGTYVVMGWLCLLAAPQMPSVLSPNAIVWLILGGIIYTLGAVIYATKIFNFVPGKFGFHEIWHIFVLLGAMAHFVAVMSVITKVG